jgi:hypothetical protein
VFKFSEAQNGFRKVKSIDTTVQAFIERIQEALNKRDHSTGIFIDLTKAYDVFNHKLLLDKLKKKNIYVNNIAISGDRNVIEKEAEKILKC